MIISQKKNYMRDLAKYKIKARVTVIDKNMETHSEVRTIEIEGETLVVAVAKYHLRLLENQHGEDRIGLWDVDFLEVKRI